MKTRVRRRSICWAPLAPMVALVFAGLISGAVIEFGYAEEPEPPPKAPPMAPQFGPVQFVVCKVDSGDGKSFFTVILPGTGQSTGWGKALSPQPDCGPFPEPESVAATTDPPPTDPPPTPKAPPMAPQFDPVQFVVCKVDSGDGKSFFTVILPGTGQPTGWGKALSPQPDCGPFPE